MPNLIAYGALIAWPFIGLLQFLRLRPRTAIIWAILGAYLLLPVKTQFDFPGVPPLDKELIPNLTALVLAMTLTRFKLYLLPRSVLVKAAIFVFVLSPFLTSLGNPDPIVLTNQTLAAMSFYDAFAAAVRQAAILIPFLLGYQMLGDEDGHRRILWALMIAGLAYSALMLIEIRLSPQLHAIIYGFFPHSFSQQVRDGGYRPVVFLGHGLLVAIFCAMSLLSVAALSRMRRSVAGVPMIVILVYLAIILVLCRSLGALILTLCAAPLVLFARPRFMVLVAACLGLCILSYPALRGAGLIPVETVTALSGSASDDRQGSFKFRLENEDQLLEKVSERPLFGWGTWGRNRLYKGYGGRDSSTTDGTWIIVVGIYGWVGYIACFGLLCYPLIARLRRGRASGAIPLATASLGIVHMINLLDLIPNSSLTPVTWLIAGALSGAVAQKWKAAPPVTAQEESTQQS